MPIAKPIGKGNPLTRRARIAAAVCLVCLFAGAPVPAQQLPKALAWGADAEGGAPYEFQDPRDPSRVIGFEVDVAEALARIMKVPLHFVQNQWEGLVPGLERGNYDMIISGLEITPERSRVISFSRPYYVTYEQLVVLASNPNLRSLEDCRERNVGTLRASLAERMLQARGNIRVVSYDGQINAYEDLNNGRLDAVLMDYIIALYNVAPMPQLKMIGPQVGRVEYGIGIRKENSTLLRQVDDAIAAMMASGELRRILQNWNLWTPMCAEYFADTSTDTPRAHAYEQYVESRTERVSGWAKTRRYIGYLPLLGKGALVTLELSLVSMLLAVLLGLALALTNLYAPSVFRSLASFYVEAVRGTPLLIQLFLIFYGLPHVGIRLSPMLAAIFGLGLNYGAYEAENYRAGIQSIPRTQMEAALALGMTRVQALRHVIVPQAMRLVLPPVTNDFIALLKDSSLVSVITMVELTKAYSELASIHYDYLGIGLLAAAMYFLIGLPFVRLARLAEIYFSPARGALAVGAKQRQSA
jgi:polar amino acid transport system substrate-binding protein